MDFSILWIGGYPVIARNMREASEIQEVVKLAPAGPDASIAARHDAEPVASGNRHPGLSPKLDPPRSTCKRAIGLDGSTLPDVRAGCPEQRPCPEPALGETSQTGGKDHCAGLHMLYLRNGREPRRLEIEPAFRIAQPPVAVALQRASYRRVQRLRQSPQFHLERAVRAPDLAKAPGEDQRPQLRPRQSTSQCSIAARSNRPAPISASDTPASLSAPMT